MTDSSGSLAPDSRYRLRTFGTFGLLGPGDETILGTHGHQHRRLALLAVLAASGKSGRSRDQLLLLFWPDATQARARHSLEQLLYAIRSSVNENVFAGVNPVRVNPDVLTSDVALFNDALERGDFEAAVNEYRGPFLDGFYLSDSPEFEQWLGEERARLERAHTNALEHLAKNAEAQNDHVGAVRWWQKLVEADPVSSKYATGFIRALSNAGDYGAALKYAEQYQAIVARELGSDVGPAVASLVAEVQAAAKTDAVPHVRHEKTVAQAVEEPVEVFQDEIPPRRRPTSRLIAAGAVIVLLIAIAGAWLSSKANDGDEAGMNQASIAVLPLANVGGKADDASFVDGLSEELMAALARIDGLRVIGSTSAFAFKNSSLGARRISDSLGVSNVVEGSVQRDGSRLRVQVRLVDARDGSTRWSETFNRELVDVFGVQSEIATAVARELDLRLRAGDVKKIRQGSTRNIAAYDLYLRGRDPIHNRASDSVKLRALDYLKQAVALDPGFAAAYANMPYWYVAVSGDADRDSLRILQRLADSTARIALRLDPMLAESHIAGAMSQVLGSGTLAGVEAELRRALEIGGAPRAREHLANVLLWTGRPEEALAENLRASQDNPLSASAAADLGRTLCFNGRYSEGLAQLARVSAVRPPLARVRTWIAHCHAMKGEWSEAVALMRTTRPPGNPDNAFLGYFLGRAGDSAEAKRIMAQLVERWRETNRGAMSVATVAAGLGDYDTAFEWMNRVGVDHLGYHKGQIMLPIFGDLHRDPRFEGTARRLGLLKR